MRQLQIYIYIINNELRTQGDIYPWRKDNIWIKKEKRSRQTVQ